MNRKFKTIFIILFGVFFTLLFLSFVKTASAINLESVVAKSEVGDKVYEISGDTWYAYQNSTSGAVAPEPPAPTSWKLSSYSYASWSNARDAYESNPSVTEGAPFWWCSEFGINYPINCKPFNESGSYTVKQIVGPSGFVNKETLLFRDSFTISPPSSYKTKEIRLDLWSDNHSWAWIDNTYVSTAGLSNPTTTPYSPQTTTMGISALGISSTATVTKQLAIQVSNDDQGTNNPIGLSYRVTVVYEPIPNCQNLTGPSSMTVGVPGTFSVNAYSPGGINVSGGISASTVKTSLSSQWAWDNWESFNSSSVTIIKTWTPTVSGTYEVFCRVAHNSTPWAECRGGTGYADGDPVFDCAGPSSIKTVTVLAPTATVAPTPIPPTINSLKVNNSSDNQTTFPGPYKISGKTAEPNQNGSNWLNPMTITLNVTQGSSAIKNRYVAFYTGTKLTTASAFLNTVKQRVNDPYQGFLLAYGAPLISGDSGDQNHYLYVWSSSGGNWVNISNVSQGRDITGSDGKLLFTVSPVGSNSWKIRFDQNFQSKSLFTGVYVDDTSGKVAFDGDKDPQQ